MTAARRAPLSALTGLRAVLALHVLLYHAFFTFGRARVLLEPGPARTIISAGYVGVNAFFVLSGFVLAYAYVGDDGAMQAAPSAFFRARFARIYPMHVVGVLMALPLFFLQSVEARAPSNAIVTEGAKEILVCLALLQAFFPRFVFALNGPSWSLSVEAVFYLGFPLVVRALARSKRRGLFVALLLSYALALVAPIAHGLHAPPVERATAQDLVVRFDPLLRLPELVFGFALGRLFASWPRKTTPDWRWDARLLAALFATVYLLAQSDTLPEPLVHGGLLDPLFAVLFVCAARSTLAETTLGGRPLVLLGRASFALYVIHKPVWFWLLRLMPRSVSPISVQMVAIYVAVALVLAALFYRVVEEPARRWLTSRARTPR
jgi:peptidoglycan/LPS O-acetylase OafA/YrhL